MKYPTMKKIYKKPISKTIFIDCDSIIASSPELDIIEEEIEDENDVMSREFHHTSIWDQEW